MQCCQADPFANGIGENEDIPITHKQQQQQHQQNQHNGMGMNKNKDGACCIDPLWYMRSDGRRVGDQSSSSGSLVENVSLISAVDHKRAGKTGEQLLPPDEEALSGDDLLASDMKNLTMDEIEHVYNDIHGVADVVDEEPGFVNRCLDRLELELSRIREAAYDKAMFLNPAYLKSRSFRLMFLRSEEFNAKKTAKKIIMHFRCKLELFGLESLGRRIVWDDLDEETQALLNTGSLQFFSKFCRDQSGRGLFYITYQCRKNYTDDSDEPEVHYARALWYTVMMGIQDDELTQRNGAVGVMYAVGVPISDFSRVLITDSKKVIIPGLPIRPVGAHMCFSDNRLKQTFSLLLAAAPKQVRLRMRIHVGSHLENQYALNSFGVNGDMLPFDHNGNLKEIDFRNRLEGIRKLENTVVEPVCASQKDVLLGRGVPYRNHAGNIHLLRVVESFQTIHATAPTRAIKTRLFQDIVDIVHERNSKFLKRMDVGKGDERWEEVNNKLARERVAQCFRNRSSSRQGKATKA